jgi:hypothetical protein
MRHFARSPTAPPQYLLVRESDYQTSAGSSVSMIAGHFCRSISKGPLEKRCVAPGAKRSQPAPGIALGLW